MPAHRYTLIGLDTASASTLHTELLAYQGEPIMVDASQVVAGGTLGLQVLVSAAKSWEAENNEFSIIHASQPFLEALNVLGISPSQLKVQTGS